MTTPQEYATNEVVNVSIRRAVVRGFDADERLLTIEYGERRFVVELDLDEGCVTVGREVPAQGEPQPGDLWADRWDCVYFARKSSSGLDLVPPSGPTRPWQTVNRESGPLRLVRASEAASEGESGGVL